MQKKYISNWKDIIYGLIIISGANADQYCLNTSNNEEDL